ncbi:MAG: serine hydrolase domain-containing protein [Bacteroidota bacterium]|jgi:CubicO group peptidase (beta-lactamase class C family)
MRNLIQWILKGVVTAMLLLPNTCIAQENKAEVAIHQIMKENPVMGLSVAVVKNNKIIYTQSFGLKDAETNTPLNNENIFRIASISKSFSATAIMQLVEAKKLSLDQDVSELVGFKVRNPKFPETVITLRLMLSHLSSINDSQGYFSLDSINPATSANWEKCYNNYEPSKGYAYCNLNFNMIGTIIEKVSGERFDAYIQNHILKPLQLYGGYYVNGLDKSKFATIYEYQPNAAKFVVSPNAYAPRTTEVAAYQMGYSTPIFSPTGGMKISAQDLATYMMMHTNYGKYNGVRIISKKSSKLMQTAVSDIEPYGFALETPGSIIDGKKMIGHTGSAYGLFSAMFFNPQKKYGIVVISNGCHPGETSGYNNVIRKTVNALYENLINN